MSSKSGWSLAQGKAKALPQFTVQTNHVRLTNWPQDVVAYKVEWSKVKPNPATGHNGRSITSSKELRCAILALCDRIRQFYNLGFHQVATDCKNFIWASQKLEDLERFNSSLRPGLTYHKINGDTEQVSCILVLLQRYHMVSAQQPPKASWGLMDNNYRKTLAAIPDVPREPLTRALNALLTNRLVSSPASTYQRVGSNRYFNPTIPHSTAGNCLLAIQHDHPPRNSPAVFAQRGFMLSIRPGRIGPLLNLNTTTATFLGQCNLALFLSHFPPLAEKDSVKARLFREQVQRSLIGRKVRLLYDRGWRATSGPAINQDALERRIKVITEFGIVPNRQEIPVTNDDKSSEKIKIAQATWGRPVTVADWFENLRQTRAKPASSPANTFIRLRGPNTTYPTVGNELPCANVGTISTPVWVPCQLLELVGNQPAPPKITQAYVDRILPVASRPPSENVQEINSNGFATLRRCIAGESNAIEVFKSEDALLRVPARKLPTPIVTYRNSNANLRNASWNLEHATFHDLQIGKCAFVASSIGDMKEWSLFHQTMLRMVNVHRSVPAPEARWAVKPDSLEIPKTAANLLAQLDSVGADLAIVVLSNPTMPKEATGVSQYAEARRLADLQKGKRIVFMKVSTFEGAKGTGKDIVCANIAAKLNVKAGGVNHRVDWSFLQRYNLSENLIVLGADVTHPGGGAVQGCPSIACIVGSVGSQHDTLLGSMSLQSSKQERIADMVKMTRERLLAYADSNNGRLPGKVLFFRDGVSESQYSFECQEEISDIRAAFAQLVEKGKAKAVSKAVKITYIVCGKRHHTRFYPVAGNHRDATPKRFCQENQNLAPGLVVSEHVTHPTNEEDFFLQSHSAIKGTARPAHYYTITNDLQIDLEGLQRITHAFCYNYARATKGVSYAAPAYYADRLCDRGRIYLEAYMSPDPRNLPDMPFKNDANNQEKPKAQWLQECVDRVKQQARPGDWQRPIGPWHGALDKVMHFL